MAAKKYVVALISISNVFVRWLATGLDCGGIANDHEHRCRIFEV
jgi:hypothetical protein